MKIIGIHGSPRLNGNSAQLMDAIMKQAEEKVDRAWRKSRLAARLLLRQEAGRMNQRDKTLARQLSQDPEVTNRLIQQALYYLGLGQRKHAFDRKLVDAAD